MQIDPEVSGIAIVIVGSFNPAIFHPSWLIANGVEDAQPEDAIKVDVVHREISRFSVGNTSYFIDGERLQIQTESAPWVQVLDKANMIVGELLPHTPVRAFGINRDIHFRLQSPEARMRLGRKLAPVEPWGRFGKEMDNQPSTEPAGLLSITLRSHEKFRKFSITKNVKLEPSALIQHTDGVYIQANFHYKKDDGDDGKTIATELVCQMLQEQFQIRVNEAEEIFNNIMGTV